MRAGRYAWFSFAFGSIVVLSVAGACMDPNASMGPEISAKHNATQDCQMSPSHCEQIEQAIAYLEGSTQSHCAGRGAAARARFNAIGHGFRYGNGAGDPNSGHYDMYTVWDPDYVTGTFTDGNTYVNAGGLVIFTEIMAGLISHEEVHHAGQDNPSHVFNVAYPTQNACVLG